MIFLPYQRVAWRRAHQHRVSGLIWSRQSGKSTFLSGYAVDTAIVPGNNVIVASSSRRAVRELMTRIGDVVSSLFPGLKPGIEQIHIPGGSRIISVPANPRTARGWTGHVIWDEADFAADPEEYWGRALYPMISRPGLRAVISSTPLCEGSFLHSLTEGYTGRPAPDSDLPAKYPFTIVPITRAIGEGLPRDYAEIERECDDSDKFDAEYMCRFIPRGGMFFDLAVVRDAQTNTSESWDEIIGGIDIARDKDRTALVRIGKTGTRYHVIDYQVFARGTSFPLQIEEATNWIKANNFRCVGSDDSAIGRAFTDFLSKEFPGRIVGVKPTAQKQPELAGRIKRMLAGRELTLAYDRDLVNEFRRIRMTPTGTIATSRDADHGHGDVFWALAYAIEARRQLREALPETGRVVSDAPRRDRHQDKKRVKF